jgi:hypothetical protein
MNGRGLLKDTIATFAWVEGNHEKLELRMPVVPQTISVQRIRNANRYTAMTETDGGAGRAQNLIQEVRRLGSGKVRSGHHGQGKNNKGYGHK